MAKRPPFASKTLARTGCVLYGQVRSDEPINPNQPHSGVRRRPRLLVRTVFPDPRADHRRGGAALFEQGSLAVHGGADVDRAGAWLRLPRGSRGGRSCRRARRGARRFSCQVDGCIARLHRVGGQSRPAPDPLCFPADPNFRGGVRAGCARVQEIILERVLHGGAGHRDGNSNDRRVRHGHLLTWLGPDRVEHRHRGFGPVPRDVIRGRGERDRSRRRGRAAQGTWRE